MTPSKTSAGLLMFRRTPSGPEVFLVHPGGPYFRRKDLGAWTIPKGEFGPGEDPLEVARREFREETGREFSAVARDATLIPLGSVRQRGGKIVHAWAFEGDWPAGAAVESNRFSLEWPPRSGRLREFPEVDQGQFFPMAAARAKINAAQGELLDRLLERLANPHRPHPPAASGDPGAGADRAKER